MTTHVTPPLSPEHEYYENELLWAQDFEQNPEERARLDAVAAAIPPGVNSVLDVGCGNGAFLHRLEGTYRRICGVDRSEAALKFVRTEKRIASADDLPFDEGEFDLVTCMEVIEHLPQAAFGRALDELLRVSARWLVITVPFREDRRLSLVRCPECLCEFNRSYHLRSFDDAAMHHLFEHRARGRAELRQLTTLGIVPHLVGLYVVRRVAEPLRTLDLPTGVICPQCGHRREAAEQPRERAVEGVLRRWRVLQRVWPSRHRPRWYVGVYEKS